MTKEIAEIGASRGDAVQPPARDIGEQDRVAGVTPDEIAAGVKAEARALALSLQNGINVHIAPETPILPEDDKIFGEMTR